MSDRIAVLKTSPAIERCDACPAPILPAEVQVVSWQRGAVDVRATLRREHVRCAPDGTVPYPPITVGGTFANPAARVELDAALAVARAEVGHAL